MIGRNGALIPEKNVHGEPWDGRRARNGLVHGAWSRSPGESERDAPLLASDVDQDLGEPVRGSGGQVRSR